MTKWIHRLLFVYGSKESDYFLYMEVNTWSSSQETRRQISRAGLRTIWPAVDCGRQACFRNGGGGAILNNLWEDQDFKTCKWQALKTISKSTNEGGNFSTFSSSLSLFSRTHAQATNIKDRVTRLSKGFSLWHSQPDLLWENSWLWYPESRGRL